MVPLKSARVGQVMLWLLRIALPFHGLLTSLTLIKITLPATPPIITTLEHLLTQSWIAMPFGFVYLGIVLFSIEWLYHLHNDLRLFYRRYPIGAWDAVIRFIFPGYNIWGIWSTLMTIARYFKAETDRLHHYRLLLHRLVPVMYSIFTALYLLERLMYRNEGIVKIKPIIDIPESLVPVVIAGEAILSLGMMFVLLAMAQIIVNAMQLKVRQISNINDVDLT